MTAGPATPGSPTAQPPDRILGRPRGRIVKAAAAQAWMDGYAFLETAKVAAKEQQAAARKAYGDSYAQGYEDGRSEGVAEAARLVHATAAKVDQYLGSLENEIAGLALDIVARVLGPLDTGSVIAHAARQALADLRRSKYIKIAVNPAVETAVRNELADLVASETLPLEIQGDPELPPDACIVSSDIVVIDASIKVQLEAIRASLQASGAAPADAGLE
jgi:type III secretion protein L